MACVCVSVCVRERERKDIFPDLFSEFRIFVMTFEDTANKASKDYFLTVTYYHL